MEDVVTTFVPPVGLAIRKVERIEHVDSNIAVMAYSRHGKQAYYHLKMTSDSNWLTLKQLVAKDFCHVSATTLRDRIYSGKYKSVLLAMTAVVKSNNGNYKGYKPKKPKKPSEIDNLLTTKW